jgi:protocatechuate 3,4-dioxygenase beta subunit
MGDQEKDNQQEIRTFGRRDALKLVGAAGTGIVNPILIQAMQNTSGCLVRPEQTEGPYFVDEELNRHDIRSDPSDGSVVDGIPLELVFRVSQVTPRGCSPLEGATVDIWHCDARGFYSDVRDRSFNTVGKKFLRGYQITDKSGVARFKTIYPGWYPGRTVHIHFKIRTDPAAGTRREFTSQLYFDDTLTDQVFTQAPYSNRSRRMMRNEDDFIYRVGGKQLILAPKKDGEGYSATFEIALR